MLTPSKPTIIIQFKTCLKIHQATVGHYLLGWLGAPGPVWGLSCVSVPGQDGGHVNLWSLSLKTYSASVAETALNAVLTYNAVFNSSVDIGYTEEPDEVLSGRSNLKSNDGWETALCDLNARRAEQIDDARLESESALAAARAELEELQEAYQCALNKIMELSRTLTEPRKSRY